MGFISSVGSFLVKTVAPAVFKAVLPSVSAKLAEVADKFIGGAGNIAKGLASALPGPLSGLANKLIDMGVAKAQDLASPKAFEDLIKRLAGQPRDVAGAPPGTQVTLPPQGSPARTAGQAAATAATAAGIAAAGGGSSVGGGGDVADQAIRAIGALTEPAIPGPDATPQQLAQYEKDTKRYDRMMELMSSIIKKRDELQMSIIRKM